MKQSKNSRITGTGSDCPKCQKAMARKEHPNTWTPKENQPFYFAYWDVCQRCRHVQHYEVAKVIVGEKDGQKDQLTG